MVPWSNASSSGFSTTTTTTTTFHCAEYLEEKKELGL
jgi:hypothetical protein